MPRTILFTVFAILCTSPLQACAPLPRVVVLHDPLTAQEHVALGVIYERKGHLDPAIQEYQAALRQDGSYVPAWMGLGNVSYATGAFSESEAYYRQALALAPEHPAANNNLAMTYLALNERLDEAAALVKRALEQAGPLRPHVLDTLARIYLKQGRCDEAGTALRDAEAAVSSEETGIRERLQEVKQGLSSCRGASARLAEHVDGPDSLPLTPGAG